MAKAKDGGEDPEVVRRRLADHENAHDLVPGTAHNNGPKVPPSGGLSWEGAARMAKARDAAGKRLNGQDREALDRHPNPGGYAGGDR